MSLLLLYAARETIIMKHNDVKQYLRIAPISPAWMMPRELFFYGAGRKFNSIQERPLRRRVIAGRHVLPFALGELLVEIGGKRVGRVPKTRFLARWPILSRTKRARPPSARGSLGAFVLKIRLTKAELGSPRFTGLKTYLGAQAWDTFVSNSQRAV